MLLDAVHEIFPLAFGNGVELPGETPVGRFVDAGLSLQRAIRQLDADDDLCTALSAAGKVQAESFSPARYAQRLGTLYQKLI